MNKKKNCTKHQRLAILMISRERAFSTHSNSNVSTYYTASERDINGEKKREKINMKRLRAL